MTFEDSLTPALLRPAYTILRLAYTILRPVYIARNDVTKRGNIVPVIAIGGAAPSGIFQAYEDDGLFTPGGSGDDQETKQRPRGGPKERMYPTTFEQASKKRRTRGGLDMK
ncbi:hypothetical protein C7475_102696 [Chitinophaga sp. S165]|nr:hypothetical protein C7475_102696 [Chitinophaga sp. S165]